MTSSASFVAMLVPASAAMALRWMAAGTVLIAGEKTLRHGVGLSRIVAVVLAFGAVAMWLI